MSAEIENGVNEENREVLLREQREKEQRNRITEIVEENNEEVGLEAAEKGEILNIDNVNFTEMLKGMKRANQAKIKKEFSEEAGKLIDKHDANAECILEKHSTWKLDAGLDSELKDNREKFKIERKKLLDQCNEKKREWDLRSQKGIMDKYGEENILARIEELKEKKRTEGRSALTRAERDDLKTLTEICESCKKRQEPDRDENHVNKDRNEKKWIEPERGL
ncbi:MAG: hypothetical protein PHI90_09095 [Clostridia bacterium]|nr:hypothetical protein [Clostridia bacterium]MDD4048953.1 hypothetical protein [Clostridia bacterium]